MRNLAFFFIILFFSCGNKTGKISGDEYVIFKTLYNDDSYFELSHSEIKEIEDLIKDDVKILKYYRRLKSEELGYKGLKRSEHNTYIRQYFAYYDKNNNKIVEILFMCNPLNKPKESGNWKEDFIGNVMDGGSCYPHFRVNFSSKKIISSEIELIKEFLDKKILDY